MLVVGAAYRWLTPTAGSPALADGSIPNEQELEEVVVGLSLSRGHDDG